ERPVGPDIDRRGAMKAFVRTLIVGLLATVQLSGASFVRSAGALDGSAFQAGYIISDQQFYNSGTMDATAIQIFLNARYQGCNAGAVCLRDYTTSTPNQVAEANLCNGYTGAVSESAAQILAKIAVSCGVNPQVLLVLLQKESS